MYNIKLFVLMPLSLMIFGCSMKIDDFYYISLEENREIEVLKRGEISVDGLILNSSVPRNYRLERDGYTLIFDILDRWEPTLEITVTNKNEEKYFRIKSILVDGNDVSVSDECNLFHTKKSQKINTSHIEIGYRRHCLSQSSTKNVVLNLSDANNHDFDFIELQLDYIKDGLQFYFDAI